MLSSVCICVDTLVTKSQHHWAQDFVPSWYHQFLFTVFEATLLSTESPQLFFFNFLNLFMIDIEREREAETQAEGEAGSTPGTRCGTRSRACRIAPWAKGGRQPAEPPRDPLGSLLYMTAGWSWVSAAPYRQYLPSLTNLALLMARGTGFAALAHLSPYIPSPLPFPKQCAASMRLQGKPEFWTWRRNSAPLLGWFATYLTR